MNTEPPEGLVKLLRMDADFGRKQGTPHLLSMQQVLLSLIYESGHSIEELQAKYSAALSRVRNERLDAETKRQKLRLSLEEGWEKSARVWLEKNLEFPGAPLKCGRPNPRTGKSCGGSLDLFAGLVHRLKGTTGEDHFGQPSKDALLRFLSSGGTVFATCERCENGVPFPKNAVRLKI